MLVSLIPIKTDEISARPGIYRYTAYIAVRSIGHPMPASRQNQHLSTPVQTRSDANSYRVRVFRTDVPMSAGVKDPKCFSFGGDATLRGDF